MSWAQCERGAIAWADVELGVLVASGHAATLEHRRQVFESAVLTGSLYWGSNGIRFWLRGEPARLTNGERCGLLRRMDIALGDSPWMAWACWAYRRVLGVLGAQA